MATHLGSTGANAAGGGQQPGGVQTNPAIIKRVKALQAAYADFSTDALDQSISSGVGVRAEGEDSYIGHRMRVARKCNFRVWAQSAPRTCV